MRKGPKSKLMFVFLICFVLTTGCVEQKQLEKLGLITATGFDLEKENIIKGTIVVHKFDPMAQNLTKVISSSANTSRGLKQQQNLESNQKLVSGQLRCVVYSEELAKKGIIQLVDALNRDTTVGNMVYLTISEATAASIMNLDRENPLINLGTYLYNLIKQNVEGEQILSPTLQEFNHLYYDIGKDPVLPILKIKDRDVVISGMGIFKDDRFVGRLKPNKLFYLKILSDKYKAGSQEIGFNRAQFEKIRMKKGEHAIRNVYNKLFLNLDNINSSSKIQLVDKAALHFRVEVKLNSRLLETTEPLDVSNPAAIKFIEKKLNGAMKKEIVNILEYFQKINADPVGFGNEYKTHVRGKNLTKKEWRSLYKRATFDVHVKNTVIQTGVVD